jgi:hypothetical protein
MTFCVSISSSFDRRGHQLYTGLAIKTLSDTITEPSDWLPPAEMCKTQPDRVETARIEDRRRRGWDLSLSSPFPAKIRS